MSGSGGISLWSRVRELEGDALRQIQLELHKSDNNNANKRKILKSADFANFHISQEKGSYHIGLSMLSISQMSMLSISQINHKIPKTFEFTLTPTLAGGLCEDQKL